MTAPSILEKVLAIVGAVAGSGRTPPDAGPETPLAQDGYWLESVELLEVLVACEETFNFDFDPDMDVTEETLRSVGTLADVIERKQASSV
jgi:acyl carrier protein